MRTPRCSCSFPSDIDTPPTSNVGGECSVGMDSSSSKADGDSEIHRDEHWGSVSDEEEDLSLFPPHQHSCNSSRRGEGVLIISGDEESTVDSYRRGILNHHDPRSNPPPILSVEHLSRSGAELSLPGTDGSLPTDLDSLDVGSSLLRDDRSKKETNHPENQNENGNENEAVNPVKKVGLHRTFVLLAVSLACMVFISAFLAWDRYSWRSNAVRLEEELNLLQAKMKEAQEQTERLLHQAKKNNADYSKDNNDQNSEGGNDRFFFDPKEEQKFKLADNCWLQAEASFTLGSCADQAKERAKDATDHFWEWFAKMQNTFQDNNVSDQDAHNDKEQNDARKSPKDVTEYVWEWFAEIQKTLQDDLFSHQDVQSDRQRNETRKGAKDMTDHVWGWITELQKTFQDDNVSEQDLHNHKQRGDRKKSSSEYCLGNKGMCFSPKWKLPQQAGVTPDDISDISHSIATATVAAGDAMMDLVHGASSLVEDYVKEVMDITIDSMGDDSILEFMD